MMKVRITSSSADPRTYKVVNVETGEEVKDIARLNLEVIPSGGALARITLLAQIESVDVVANALVEGYEHTIPGSRLK